MRPLSNLGLTSAREREGRQLVLGQGCSLTGAVYACAQRAFALVQFKRISRSS